MADQVDRLQQQLTAHGRDWRKRAGDHLQSLAGAAPGTAATPDAEPDNLVRPGTTDRRSTVQDGPGRSRRRGRVPKRAKTASTIVATLAVGGVLGAAIWNNDSSEGGATSAGEKAAGPESGATATPGTLEKGGLGEDSRCSTSFKGPEAVTWRVCALVEAERVSFALKLTNRSRAESIVVIRLEYARASAFHPCPKAPSPRSLSVPAGKTVITDTGQCALPREKTPAAYQGVGWVFAVNTNTASYELSPTANVYPDRVIWKPDLVEQSSAMSVSQAGRVTVL
ncbi:hypothetical protein AB0D59_37200 [Streptomyces sp. NPDC048417]|uniref:hypothetical protein n=1 Tax=Streptomyces sp. NPDC048417 TaxID=3155387 RepID=UPI003416FF51